MDFMIAYFPILKAGFAVFGLGLAYWFWYKKLYKAALGVILFIAVVGWFAPVKYDGTNTIQHSKKQQAQRTAEYNNVDIPKVVTVKKTFAERMAEEDARSTDKDTKLKEDLGL